ncbi:MAG: putative molybdenum carrier protein [Gammaproteobacteria bacterium]
MIRLVVAYLRDLKMLVKIISGGQTGVDLAALDIALKFGVDYGGACTKGRFNELGQIPVKYKKLFEINYTGKDEKENYSKRTIQNIHDADATLVLVPKLPLPKNITDGTTLTVEAVQKTNKPFLIIDLSLKMELNIEKVINWFGDNDVKVLNIAGPRESQSPNIYNVSSSFLEALMIQMVILP